MSVKLYFEVGHVAALKSKAAPNGFTHDWELFVRGSDGNNNINRIIDKVVFNLHDSFPKPKRAIKEPPFTLKESGYAGFELPVEIYFKNRERTSITYDLNLQQTGTVQNVEKHSFTFENASSDFRRKLMDCGGMPISAGGQNDDRSRDGVEERSQLISKPKLGGSLGDSKKHKNRPIMDEPRPTSTFANLFGTPITKMSSSSATSKVSPEQKIIVGSSSGKNSGNNSVSNSNISSGSKISSQKTSDKLSSKDKTDKSSKEKKDKSKYASPNREGTNKDSSSKKGSALDEKRGRDEKRKEKSHTKERDRSRDKILKRPPSPKPASRSPKRSSPVRPININRHVDSQPSTQKYGGGGSGTGGDDKSSSSAKKSKKEKKEKDRDRERSGEKKDKELKHQSKDREVRSSSKTLEKIDGKQRDVGSSTPKDKDLPKDKKSVIDIKSSDYDHPSSESKAPSTSNDTKKSDKSEKDSERKHKHKKKDKNKERDKDRSSSKERKKDKDKSSKQKEANIEISHVAAAITGNSGSKKIGIATISQNVAIVQPMQQITAKINPLDAMINEMNDSDTSGTDAEMNHVSPPPQHSAKNTSSDKPDVLDHLGADYHSNSGGNLPDVIASKLNLPPSHALSHSPIPKPESSAAKNADKASKRAAKEAAKAAEKEDKKRKRKVKDEQPQSGDDKRRLTPSPSVSNGPLPPPHHTKIAKKDEQLIRLPYEKNEPQTLSPLQSNQINSNHAPSANSPAPSSSGHHNNSNDNFPSSSPCNAVTPTSTGEAYRSPVEGITVDYMAELKVLQNKIMGLQNNSELQQVVELIAETGCYEITSKTFDFDLCALDRVTVQRLQEFFAQCVS